MLKLYESKRTMDVSPCARSSLEFDLRHLYTMHWLARVHSSQQRYGDAELIFKRVLSIQTKAFGSEDPDTLATMHELARVYNLQHDDAEVLFTQVLLETEKIYGSGHPETDTTKNCLARVYYAQSRSFEAAALLVHVLARREEIFGHSHPSTQESMRLLSWVYEDLGWSADAAVLRQRLVPSS